jgi:hypothetical protein
MTARRRPASDAERGTILVLVTLLLTALLGAAALVIDLGVTRSRVRIDQNIVDLAALGAGRNLAQSNPSGACQMAINYINSNALLTTSINATTFCAQTGNDVTKTICSNGGTLTEAKPTATSGRYTVSIHFPVPDSEISDSNISGGARLNDGTQCQRMRVIVTATDTRLFSKVLGTGNLTTTRSATVKPSNNNGTQTPALWLLDPTGCVTLNVTGGSQVTVGTSTIPGVITSDSDGTTCSSNSDTVSVSGSGTKVTAFPTSGATAGSVQLLALPTTATVCADPACSTSDVSNGRLAPQPVAEGARGTRGPVDWKYNCKDGYPTYHGIIIRDCPNSLTTPPYIDRLVSQIGNSGKPDTTWFQWTRDGPTGGYSCNPSGTITVPAGNWWVDCNGSNGLQIGNGVNIDFQAGNVVFQNGFKMTGGSLKFNDNNSTAHLPSSCLPTTVTYPCIDNSSAAAAFVYLRNGDVNMSSGTFVADYVTVYEASGVVKVTGGAPPTWLAPTEGPFAELGLWSEQSASTFQINGGAGVTLSGVFFAPEAVPFSLSGGGDWGQQSAQFITYRFSVSGGGTLTMVPNPQSFVNQPAKSGVLIR